MLLANAEMRQKLVKAFMMLVVPLISFDLGYSPLFFVNLDYERKALSFALKGFPSAHFL